MQEVYMNLLKLKKGEMIPLVTLKWENFEL